MATNRTVFTSMNKDSWEAGLRWVRSVKQSNLGLLVIDMGLEESHVDKLQELGVTVAPNVKKADVPQVDVFNSFLAHTKSGAGTFLFWDTEAQAESVNALWGSKLTAPPLKEVNLASLVFPLSAIDSRVRIGSQLEKDVIEKYGSPLYSGLMAGKLQEWRLFVGLYNSLVETGVVETLVSARNLVLNLFALYFPDHIEPKPVEYQISALQPENQG